MKVRSSRIENLAQSDIRAMTVAANRVGAINLGQGICDVPTPDIVRNSAIDALRSDRSAYSRFDGVDPLRKALSQKLRHYNGVQYDEDTEIVATVGASGAFACTVQALFEPGDELILFEPFYGYHRKAAEVAGVEIVPHRLNPPNFDIDVELLRSQVNERTRAVLVNTPNNPSGKTFTRTELEAIAAICIENDILCITDEIYEYIVYEHEHISMASLPDMRERTITISGYSKTFSITGWRIGYAAAPAPFAEAIGLMNDLYYICAPTPLQHGVAHAIAHLDDSYYRGMIESYGAKRRQICDTLDEVGLPCIRPQGAYYVLADTSELGCSDARSAANVLLEKAGVAGIPGSAFFSDDTGESLIRFCYAKRPEDIDEACTRLRRWAGRAGA